MKFLKYLTILLFLPLVSAQSTIGQAKEFLPEFNVGNIGLVITFFILALIILLIAGVGIFFLVRWLKFNRHITIWEDVEGSDSLEPVGTDKAMLIKVGKGGTELLYLKKRKTYKGAYGKRIANKKYFFVIGKDGYWYNSTLGSLEEGMAKIDVKPTNVNMRYQNESLMELIKERYDKPSFWGQYGQIIINIAFFMLVAVMFWLYFDSFKETAPALVEASKTLKETAEVLGQVTGGLDSLKSTGGIRLA